MDDLSFLPSDFAAIPSYKPEELALWANKKLARKLDKATKVYKLEGQNSWTEEPQTNPINTARLVNIK